MKKNVLTILAVFIAMVFASCSSKDDVDGRDQYVATYQVTDSWAEGGVAKKCSYTMTVSKSEQDSKVILLSNFGGENGVVIKAEVNGNKFTIAQQTVQAYGYSGSGSITGSTLSFSFQESSSGNNIWNVSSIGTKM